MYEHKGQTLEMQQILTQLSVHFFLTEPVELVRRTKCSSELIQMVYVESLTVREKIVMV